MRRIYAFSLLLLLLSVPAAGRSADFPTGGSGNATKILGTTVPTLSTIGGVLTVGAGPTLTWSTPAAGLALSNTTPAAVSPTAGAVGVGTTAARSDHVHVLPVIPLTLGGFGQSLVGLLTTPTELGFVHGVTSAIQAQLDAKQATLTLPLTEANGGLGANVSSIGTGLMCRSSANTPVTRTITGPAAGITFSNGDGVAGNPTLALANDLAALEALSSTGIAVRTATDTWAQRSIASGTGTTVTNGTGVSGNISVNVTYGTGSSTATQGNDTRLPPAPGTTGSGLYDNGSAWTRLAIGTSGQTYVANAGGFPTWESRPATIVTGTATGGLIMGTSYLVPKGGAAVLGNSSYLAMGTRSGMRAKNLYCASGTLAVGSNIVFTVEVAGATTLTCTITYPEVNCNDTTHNPAVSAGNGVNISANSSAAQTAGYTPNCSFEIAIGVG